MTVCEIKDAIRKIARAKEPNRDELDRYIRQLGENINDIVDEDDTFLSELYTYVRNGRPLFC